MPFAEVQQGQVKGGILFELMNRIAARAGAEPRFVILPSRRVDRALEEGTVDLHCPISPSWYTNPPPAERWTVPLLRIDDVLLAAPGQDGRPPAFESMRQVNVGVVLGYRYPTLEAWFDGGQLRREIAPTQEKVLEKLMLGRMPYGVTNRFVAEWFNRQRSAKERMLIVKTVDSAQTHCLLAPKTGIAAARINKAVREVVESGELAAILARYH